MTLVLETDPEVEPAVSRPWLSFQNHRSLIFYYATVLVVVVTAVAWGFIQTSPARVSNITIKFMDPPRDFDKHAFAYLIYELNSQQDNWYFKVDFEIFNSDILTAEQDDRCAGADRPILCYAEVYAREHSKGKPLIGITSRPLGKAYFCEHRDNVSVISTADKQSYHLISTYDYLLFCIILESMKIHLDLHGGGLPEGVFEKDSVSHGGIFQFHSEKDALKATILAARLSPREQERLFNSFGISYAANLGRLLSLKWLHSQRVQYNLDKIDSDRRDSR